MTSPFRTCAAHALALGGVLIAMTAFARTAGEMKSVARHRLVDDDVQSRKFHNVKRVCAKGWSKHKSNSKLNTGVQSSMLVGRDRAGERIRVRRHGEDLRQLH